jgi:hypothetical protein
MKLFTHQGSERRYPSEGTVVALLYGLALGALLVGIAWKVLPGVGGSGTPESSANGELAGAHSSARQARSSEASAADRRLSRCQQVYAAQQKPVRAAAVAMAQWQIHIGAMNKLVVGAITLQQATAFWNSTRVGAHAHLDAFAAADGHLRQLTVRCPSPVHHAEAGRQLAQCERAVAADWRVLDLARTALGTWGHHVKDMEMLRMGTMSPATATQMWLQSWQKGQQEVTTYRAAVSATRHLDC